MLLLLFFCTHDVSLFDHSGTQLYFVVNYLLGGLDACLSATVKVT